MAVPFPGGFDSQRDGFGPMFEDNVLGNKRPLSQGRREPRRASYSLWLLKTTVQVLATVAAMILVIKAGELMIIAAHLW